MDNLIQSMPVIYNDKGRFFKDGKFIIKKDGQLYNVSGTQLK